MSNPEKINLLKALPLVLVLAGILLRISVFVQNRSFFLDEAALANNVVEKELPDYFRYLDYDQYAPPLFLIETEIMVSLFGTRDSSFRVIPLLSGIGCLVLMLLLLREWKMEWIGQVYAIGLFAFSVLAIRYGTEFKQYSSDAFIALLLVWLAWKEKETNWQWSALLFWALFGALIIWYSMPSVFVLTGVGLFFFISKPTIFNKLLFVIGTWMLSFGLYYFLVLQADVYDTNLQNFHAEYFLQLYPFSIEALKHNGELLMSLFRSITDKTTVGIAFGIVLFALGSYELYKKDRKTLLLLLSPVLLTLGVSALQLYSLIPRMTLFLLPLMMIVVAFGLQYLWKLKHLALNGILTGLVVLSLFNKKGYTYVSTDLEAENMKGCLTFLNDNKQEDDRLYIHHEAAQAFNFYNHSAEEAYGNRDAYIAKWDELPASVIKDNERVGVWWLVYCHATSEAVEKSITPLREIGTISLHYEDYRTAVYKFSLSN